MEASSPLAALHRPMPAPAWGNRDIFRSHHHFTGPTSGSTISLREQLHKSNSDYFSAKDSRGSSPAASLAADLSQNFRLDNEASPHFPTPRRALFTASVMNGMECREYVTTPPLPSSSPAPLIEHMEVSPLPHKTPFSFQSDVNSASPTSTPCLEDMVLDSPAPIPRQSLDLPKPPSFADRRIAAPRRPSLTRMKANTFNTGSTRPQAEGQLPPFRFGGDLSASSTYTSSSLSLGECFLSESPQQEQKSTADNSPCAAPIPLSLRTRPQFLASNSSSPRLGSPMNYHARRQSNPFLRNRKQVRRSLSMFESPADVMKPRAQDREPMPTTLKSVMDIEEAHEAIVPSFLSDDPSDTIPRITKGTMLDILDGKYNEHFDQKTVIDCRFEYEYDGGHIEGAVNHNDKELLTSQLFKTPMGGRSLLVFHCEYSAHRAPLMARHVRSEDRTVNAERYPHLTYPEVYILDGGYSGFFAEYRNRCYPPEYVEMSDEKHQRTCEREMGRLKARKGLSRAQTFAFGQRGSCLNDSPTGPSRPISRQHPVVMGSLSPIPNERTHSRRMASY